MRSPLFLGLALILILSLLAACGEAAQPTAVPATAAPDPTATTAPAPTEAMMEEATEAPAAIAPTPTEAMMEEATEAPAAMSALEKYAADHAGGPGAIYVGDITQLVGPAKSVEQGDFDGNVTLDSLERHLWIYESPFYEELLEKANLLDPTPMTYDGDTITIQHACINRALLPCVALETFFAPNLLERTNGNLEFITSSFPELGLAGPDTLSLVTSGTLDSATIYGGYVGGEMPPIEIQNLWGIYSSREQEFAATQVIIKDIEELVLAETGGVIMNHNWYAGNDQFFFCREKIETLDGFEGKKTRSHSAALSDWINGMGAEAQFLAFAEVYTAIERGILDCGVTGADAGFGQRWYEVTDYIIGPLLSFPSNNNVINGDKWAGIPEDLQQIIIEEAAKSELEALRIAAIQNEMGLLKTPLTAPSRESPRGGNRCYGVRPLLGRDDLPQPEHRSDGTRGARLGEPGGRHQSFHHRRLVQPEGRPHRRSADRSGRLSGQDQLAAIRFQNARKRGGDSPPPLFHV